jgi:hypothetical protein
MERSESPLMTKSVLAKDLRKLGVAAGQTINARYQNLR